MNSTTKRIPGAKSIPAALLLTLALMMLLPGCAADGNGEGPDGARISADAPDWVRTGELPGYSQDQYIVELGISTPDHNQADAFDLAWHNGLEKISRRILARVQSEMKTVQRQVFENDTADFYEKVDIESKLETSELLAGSDRIRQWYDEETRTGYVLLANNRAKLSERLCKQAVDKKAEAIGYLESARGAGQDTSAALKSIVRARRALDVAQWNYVKVWGIGFAPGVKNRFEALYLAGTIQEVATEHDRLAGTVRLTPVEGNKQNAGLAGVLKQPVVVKVTGPGNRPLAGFPMTVKTLENNLDKATVIPHNDSTDDRGLFSFDLKELQSTGAHSNAVEVYLDYWTLEPRNDILPPHCTVTYLIPTRETTRIAVVIDETIDGQPNRRPHTASFIKDALSELGFHVIIPNTGKPARDVVDLTPTELAREFRNDCEYVIVGSAEAEFSSHESNIYWYYTRLMLNALELESGKTIPFELPMSQPTKGGGRSKNAALRKSLQNAANTANEELGAKFVARFETGAEWDEELQVEE